MIDIPDSVFPINDAGQTVCQKCKKIVSECECPAYDPDKIKLESFKPLLRLDKSGRKGKVVTVIEGLPSDEAFLKDLAKELKSRVGSGGTYYVTDAGGVIEIQGKRLERIEEILEETF